MQKIGLDTLNFKKLIPTKKDCALNSNFVFFLAAKMENVFLDKQILQQKISNLEETELRVSVFEKILGI